jgi:hypothetical protein
MSDEPQHEARESQAAAPPAGPAYPRGGGMPAYNGQTCPACGGRMLDVGPAVRPTRPPTVGTVCSACRKTGTREV